METTVFFFFKKAGRFLSVGGWPLGTEGQEEVVTLSPCPLLAPAWPMAVRTAVGGQASWLGGTGSHRGTGSHWRALREVAPPRRAGGGGPTHSLCLCYLYFFKEILFNSFFILGQVMLFHGIELSILKVHRSIVESWSQPPVSFPSGSVCS